MPTVRLSVASDIDYLAPRLRPADLDEIQAHSGVDAETALSLGFKNSYRCYTMYHDDEVFGMFGAVPSDEPSVGFVWMLGSEGITKYRWRVLRESKKWLSMLHERFPVLLNFVDARNSVHIQWLDWIGCKFTKVHPSFGVEKRPFIEFISCAIQSPLH